MASLIIDSSKCNLCNECLASCPFDALEQKGHEIAVNSACKMCNLCMQACPKDAISVSKSNKFVDKDLWQGILVYAQYFEGAVHPVTIELIGIAKEMAKVVPMPIHCLIVGHEVADVAEKLLEYGVDEVFVYDDIRLSKFRVDSYANVFEDLISEIMPCVVLVGGTSIGRSLAPRVATRFKTGLTADCTKLEMKPSTDLVQIRPAFGGNIMAQIVTPNSRPQFATVRYKVMDRAVKCVPHGKITDKQVTAELTSSDIDVINIVKKQMLPSITEAQILVVAGQGIKRKADMQMIFELAAALGGEYAVTRPLVEKGWADYTRQIGLSGRTVKPKLIITCGVSGAIQFSVCMNCSERIIAVNADKNAQILKIAHYGIVGDLYEILPSLLEKIKGAREYAI